jgi:hypothetical protein
VKEGANPAMDQMRKLVSGRLKAQAAGPHPDPESLSAFAENGLPEAERAQLLGHLGACADCREVLYLAMPDSPEAQRVLSFQPRRFSGLALRWGALAASVAIVAGLIVTVRHKPAMSRYESRVAAPPPVQIAKNEPPAVAEESRDKFAAAKQENKVLAKELPEKKHMTAKLQAGLKFDESDQVHVAAPNREKSMDLPVAGRNTVALDSEEAIAGKPESAATSATLDKDRNKIQSAQSGAGIRGDSAGGILAGTIVDPSGGLVSNVKVTASGPAGKSTAISNSDGKFSFDRLTPGSYSVKAEANGFKTTELQQVAVLDNKTPPLQMKLDVGTAAETVEVTGATVEAYAGRPAAAPQIEVSAIAQQKQMHGKTKPQKNDQMANARESTLASPAPTGAFQWTLSPEGIVQRSNDAGKTWQPVPVVANGVFRALSTVGTSIWVGGKAGTLYHSTDSGQSWTRIAPAVNGETLQADILHLDFSDASHGTVITANSEVWATSDAGQTWFRK